MSTESASPELISSTPLGADAPRWVRSAVPDLKFAVLHTGARMHYAVPALLHRADMLRAFYTDVVGNVGVMNAVRRVVPSSLRSKPVRRLFGRLLPEDVPRAAVVSSPMRSLADAALARLPGGVRSLLPLEAPMSWLQRKIIEDNFRGANALYSLDNSDLDIIRAAKRQGMFVVYEQILNADVGLIMREERARFPRLELQDSEEFVEAGIRRDLEVWNLADVVLVASDFVRQSMKRVGYTADRVALVPYGVDESWFDITPRPVPGRVLFVGTVCLRKGNHYLAEACRMLKDRGVQAEFRVVGPSDPQELASPLFEGPNYVGQVPRDQVRDEFAQADIFVLPTISESFGLVHLEAMACGVPVVTTPNCGSVVRDGMDGYIVPVRDAGALAARIEQLIKNRTLRADMGRNAKERAAKYSWAGYSRAMLGAIVRSATNGIRPAA
jgi:glycosyltransferase involved in cell wall biosynthesis